MGSQPKLSKFLLTEWFSDKYRVQGTKVVSKGDGCETKTMILSVPPCEPPCSIRKKRCGSLDSKNPTHWLLALEEPIEQCQDCFENSERSGLSLFVHHWGVRVVRGVSILMWWMVKLKCWVISVVWGPEVFQGEHLWWSSDESELSGPASARIRMLLRAFGSPYVSIDFCQTSSRLLDWK